MGRPEKLHLKNLCCQPQRCRGAEQQSPRADAARIANAKISRRKSLKKQRQAQKVSGDGLHPDEEK
jgi:hypothetical protein